MKFVNPDFHNSILNVSSTLLNYFGIDNGETKIAQLETELKKQYKNVILLVVDGLGLSILEKHLPRQSFLWENMTQRITSVFPATTTNATMTLITATSPAEHGWFGWEMNFDGKPIELFENRNRYTKEQMPGGFVEEKLPIIPFWKKQGIRKDITSFSLYSEKITDKSRDSFLYTDLANMAWRLGELCKKDGKIFVYAYYDKLDSTMHKYGATSGSAKKLVRSINNEIEKFVNANADTLLIVTADHGHIDIKEFVHMYNDNEIVECMEYSFSIEPRATAFFIKDRKNEQFEIAFKKYESDFILFKTKDLINKGIFGKFNDNKNKKYLGDYIAIGTETNKLLLFTKDSYYNQRSGAIYKGHHTGMTKEEMFVPLIIIGDKS